MTDEERARSADYLREMRNAYAGTDETASAICEVGAALVEALSPTNRERREVLAAIVMGSVKQEWAGCDHEELARIALDYADAIMRLGGEGEL